MSLWDTTITSDNGLICILQVEDIHDFLIGSRVKAGFKDESKLPV